MQLSVFIANNGTNVHTYYRMPRTYVRQHDKYMNDIQLGDIGVFANGG